ncbi:MULTISPECIES: hypothetical protein [unclassified Nocardioides]|uniref:hypothetical protein n=1 Tax=unclassified Nocardioides TaxID=2615069 RepID=UPI0009F12628|nr:MULTISPECIES: hypothetical protein [unclassified Nocardioides]GAW47810.1 hypothetical protein PD653B2_0120 [Nocardioides sp. PD653-B2]GAW53556.1 hypothetical protein PD653_0955 [Nocardioides sp. PD653]
MNGLTRATHGIAARLRALAPGKHQRSARGAAELSVVVVAASLVAGVLFGNGVTRTAVDIADGLTWFTDDPTGEVIEVNPATGRPEARLPVGADGDQLDVAQYDGRLIVTNRTTGTLTSFDLTSILASGQQRITPGGATDVLHHGDTVFLLDRERGTIADVDPVTTEAIGEMWSSPEGIADAAIDGRGHLWAIDPQGLLTELRWSSSSQQFVVEDDRQIDHSGARSVVVGHERGVTVFGPDEGIVVQVGTGHDVVADAARISGELAVPTSSPGDLVPASSPDTGTVAIVGDGQVREVEMSAIGCEKPGRPEVFEGLVYVPCTGAGRVVRLTPDGRRAGADIEVAADDGDPDLVLDDGNLLINVPGATKGAVVHSDGTVSTIVRYDESLQPSSGGAHSLVSPPAIQPITATVTSGPAVPPTNVATTPPSGPPTEQPDTSPSTGPTGEPESPGPHETRNPSTTGNPNAPHPLQAPRTVTAAELPSGSVQVTWTHAGDPADSFTVQEEDGPVLVTVSGEERQTTVSVAPGPHRFTVTAIREGDPYETSAPSNAVNTSGRPSAVTDVVGHVSGNPDDTSAAVNVSWSPATDNGSPVVSYTVVMSDAYGTQTQTFTTTSATFTTYCQSTYCNPSPVTVRITATNAKGDGPPANATLSYDGPVPPVLPAAGKQLVRDDDTTWTGFSSAGLGTTTLTLAPPPDWVQFQGTCTWTHSGNRTGDVTTEYPCSSKRISVAIDNGPARAPDDGRFDHSILFTASNGVATVTSATYEWETEQRVLCDRCS